MKYILTFIALLVHLSGWSQPGSTVMEAVFTAKDFKRIADSLQMSIHEIANYPVMTPVKMPIICSGFGMRVHPVYKVRRFHTGIDFSKRKGTAVYATGNGTVTRTGYCSGYGFYIEIAHVGGFRSFYAHLSKTMVHTGDRVNIMQQIGCVGDTGLTTGSHLHYEVRKGKGYVNPLAWCFCLYEMLQTINTN